MVEEKKEAIVRVAAVVLIVLSVAVVAVGVSVLIAYHVAA